MLSGGLWVIPLITLLGSVWFFYIGYRAWKSGSRWWGKKDGVDVIMESEDRVKWINVGQNWFGIILFAATLGILLWMYLEK